MHCLYFIAFVVGMMPCVERCVMKKPLVSIVIPTYNRVDFLRCAINSVLFQTVQDFEIIVIDDASSDSTQEFLLNLRKSNDRISYIRNEISLGGGGARNVGISASRGKWVAFLDDDDEWVNTKLEIQLEVLNSNPAAIACSGAYKQLFTSGRSKIKYPPGKVALETLLKGNCLGGASLCMCLRKVLNDIGGFDVNLRSGQDWDLWVNLCLHGEIVSSKHVLILYNAHDGLRITKNMNAQYLGLRYFYIKHRGLMCSSVRKSLLANVCFILSRQESKSIYFRLRYLVIAICNVSWSTAVSYLRSSLVRIVLACLK